LFFGHIAQYKGNDNTKNTTDQIFVIFFYNYLGIPIFRQKIGIFAKIGGS